MWTDQPETDGSSISEIVINGSVTDEDAEEDDPVPEAIAVTGVDNTDGTWQYSADDGETWTDLSDETGAAADFSDAAILLNEADRIRFVPNEEWIGTATFTFRAWDKTTGTAGETADPGEGGGLSAFSAETDEASIEVRPVNHAPELDNTKSPPSLPQINENEFENQGSSVGEFITDGFITDVDETSLMESIAVMTVDNTNGAWQYSANNGINWTTFSEEAGNVDISAEARLLSESYKIRFVPAENWFGTAKFVFRAWDKSRGRAGETADASEGGGYSAFSSATDYVSIRVKPLNRSPELDTELSPELSEIKKNNFDSSGNTVAEILPDGFVTDANNESPPEAVAVTAVDNTGGVWQYSTDNGAIWTNFSDITGSPADISAEARLLDADHRIRFVPENDWDGTATFTFRAWDKSSGTPGSTSDASGGGDLSPFSSATDTAEITVQAEPNHAPVLDVSHSPALSRISVDEFGNSGNSVAEIVTDGSVTDADADSPAESIAVTAADNTNGVWQYSSDNGGWEAFPDIVSRFFLLDETRQIRFVPNEGWSGKATFTFRAWDKSSGISGGTVDAGASGGNSAFSSETDDAAISVSNDPIADAGEDQTVFEGKTVTLDGSASSGVIATYKWTQTDGIPVTLSDVTAVQPFFAAPQVEAGDIALSFSLTLRGVDLSDGSGVPESSDTVTVTVSDVPAPVASFNAAKTSEVSETSEVSAVSGNVPLDITFTDTSQGEITEWQWNFGDGFQGLEQNPAHTYSLSGTYTVSLTVKGPGGEDTEVRNDYVTANLVPVSADFTAEPTEGPAPLKVVFTPELQGEITEQVWDFGDGKTSSLSEHVYETVGQYTVSLTVTGPGGSVTETKENHINVIGRSISGQVRILLGETEQGLEGCWVEAWTGEMFRGGATTDSNGNYEIADIPSARNILLSASPPEGTSDYFNQFYNGKETRDQADLVSTADESLADIDFVLKRKPLEGIRGRIHDDENGIPGIEVNVFSESVASGMNVLTDENGEYIATGLKSADDYRISVWSEEFSTEFYYAVPEDEEPGEQSPTYSVFSAFLSTLATPEYPPLSNIDIIVNANQGGDIEGYVYLDDGENTPVRGVGVNAWSDELDSGNGGVTDETGHYKIWGLQKVNAGEAETKGYLVEIRSAKYPYQAYNRTDQKENATRVGTGAADIDFYLKTGYGISGRVTDPAGNPVSGAEIVAWSVSASAEKQGTATSDDTGAYLISDLPIGDDYIAAVYPSDYPIQYYRLTLDENAATLIDMTGGDAVDIDFVLDKGPVVRGIVYVEDTSQVPAPAGVWVNIWSDSTRTGGDVQTDGQGRYEIAGLDEDAADYIISVRHAGYMPAFYSHEATVYQWKDAAGLATSDADRNLVLKAGFSIRGKVTYIDEPVADIRVEAKSEEGGAATKTSEVLGEFNYAVTGLPPGEYSVSITPANFLDETKTAVIENQDVRLDFALAEEPDRSISGTITGLEAGKSVQIRAWSQSRAISKSIRLEGTGDDAVYTFTDLKPAADYVAELVSEDYPYQVFDGRYRLENADFVDISDTDASDVDFVLSSDAATISGEVIFPGDASPGETVRVNIFSRVTGSGGIADIELTDSQIVSYVVTGLIRAADYVVSVQSEKYMDHYYDGSENGSENERDAQIIDTTASEETIVNLRLIRGATISGRVADSNGDPAAEVSVEAWSRSTGFYGSSVTAEDGTYIIEGLGPAPDYKVEAREQDIGSFFHNSEKTVRDRSLAESVSTADGDPEDIDIMLTEIESISGKVTDMEGYPLPLMWVDAWSELHQSGNGVFTDEDGRYEVSGLPKSRDYMVSARPDWFTVPQEKTDISSNSVEVNFVLNPREGYTLTGTVISSTGVSIPNVSVEAWSASLNIRGDIWSVTDRTGNYQLDGLPKADDYMLIVSPPKDSSYASFNEKEISVPLDGDAHNIVLSRGLNVSGTVMAKADGSPITDAQVIVISSENNFWKETVTDRYGRYNIGNMSDISDYEITVMSDSHLGQTKTEQSPGSGTDFALDRSGDISGEVKDKSTGEVRAGARVEAYSESMQGMSEFAGVAITDGDGRYVIKGLKPTDQRGNPLSDYVITVYAKGYPPLSKGARRVGDELNFALTRGKENELSGTVMGFEGELLDEIEFIGEIFERGGDYISFVKVDSDGTFKFTGLDSEKLYQVMFTAYRGDTPELIQWAAEGPSDEYDIGIESIDDPYQTPANARAYKTDTTVHFRFSYTLKRKRGRSVRGPGPVTNIDSPTHIFTKRALAGTEISTPSHNSAVSVNPYITVEWEAFDEEYDDGYYYEFNQISDHRITKRNAPDMLPLKMRETTSAELSGDDVFYYFHVAAVDNRGRIGPTSNREFRIDTVPPANGSVISPETTSNSVIALVLGATGVKEMYLSNANYGQGGEWETRVKEKQWRLTQSDGPKKVYVQFRDEAGNVANYLVETEMVTEPDLAMADHSFSVDEDSPDGTVVGTVTATNPDGALNYVITEGNADDVFAIDSGSGEITVSDGSLLDYETTGIYTLTVEASDGMNTVTATVTVNISDVDEDRPPVAEDQTFSVNENSPDGISVGTVTATDPNSDPLTYSITAGNINDVFVIDSETGNITVSDGSQLDYETTASYTLTVHVSDGTDTVTVTVTVNIDDVNEEIPNEPPVAGDQTFSVDENSPAGISAGVVTAIDRDADILTYSITAGNINDVFVIDSETGNITVSDGSQLDYETTASYTLTVHVSDGTDTVTVTVTVNIDDVNEEIPNEPPVIADQTFSVDENSPAGTSVGTVTATDPDSDTLTYSITDGNTNGTFAIDSKTGEITVNEGSQLDYETTAAYTFTVQVWDGREADTAMVTVNINDVNEEILNTPPETENQTFSVDENSADGTFVGRVTAYDADAEDILAWRIASGNTNRAFAIDSGTGEITVSDGSELDYETAAAYTLVLEVSDGRDTATALITVNIGDVNEDRLTVNDQAFSVNENSPDGTSVGSIIASGPGDTLTYTVTAGNEDNAFSVSSNTGHITVNDGSRLDYETVSVYELAVEVSDGAGMITATITINIDDLDEATLEVGDQAFSADENSSDGASVGTVVASGPSDMLTWRITAGNTDDVFAIHNETGEITVSDSSRLDYKSTPVYSLIIEVSDGENTVTAIITVNVREADAMISDQTFSIDENSPDGTSAGTVSASAPDPDTRLTFLIIGGNTDNAFAIHSRTGVITVNDSSLLDYEIVTAYALTVEVSDGRNIETATVTVNIRDVSNEHDPVISDQIFSVNENSLRGTHVGTVSAGDDDPGDKLTYKITGGNADSMFAISSDTGEITVGEGDEPDYETVSTYMLTVEVSDGANTVAATVTITVTDLNEEELTVNNQMFSADENSPDETFVGMVTASGPLDTLTYRITEGNRDDAFAIGIGTGRITVMHGNRLDYETVSSYALTVEVSDGSDTVTAVITINISDLNEEKLTVNDQSFFIDEGSPGGTSAGTVLAGSPLDTLSYSIISGNTDDAFEIGRTGEITVAHGSLPDYETTPVYTLVVGVSDGADTVTAVITINISRKIVWGWHNPLPTGNTLGSLWGSSGSDVFAVGEAGTILHYDGTDWTAMSSGMENDLRCVRGSSGSDVFAAGDAGVILRYDGREWTRTDSGVSENLRGIRFVSDSEVYVVGDAGTILHYDGESWTRMNSGTSENLHSLWGTAVSDIFAAGDAGTILRYDGTGWTRMNSGTSEGLTSMWGASGTVFAAGDAGTILHYDGTDWTQMNSGTSENLRQIWGSFESDVFAAGDYGTILHYDGISWREMDSGTSERLLGLWGDSGSDIFAVGYKGTVLHYDGISWRRMSSGFSDFLKGIWGSSDSDIFAVGGGFDYEVLEYHNTILHYDGTRWVQMDSPGSEYLYDVWGRSGSDVFAVGWGGTILHYDGTDWHEMNSGTAENLHSIRGTSESVFATGDAGTVLRHDGTRWTRMSSGTSECLNRVWAASDSDVFAAGDSGTILHYDGTEWRITDSGTAENLHALWGRSASDVFAAGDSGTILHYDGAGWTEMRGRRSDEQIRDILGVSESVFAAGDNGIILRYNGSEWKKTARATHRHIRSLWGISDSLFVAGDDGTILVIQQGG